MLDILKLKLWSMVLRIGPSTEGRLHARAEAALRRLIVRTRQGPLYRRARVTLLGARLRAAQQGLEKAEAAAAELRRQQARHRARSQSEANEADRSIAHFDEAAWRDHAGAESALSDEARRIDGDRDAHLAAVEKLRADIEPLRAEYTEALEAHKLDRARRVLRHTERRAFAPAGRRGFLLLGVLGVAAAVAAVGVGYRLSTGAAAGGFVRVGSMNDPREDFTATPLADGRVAIVGGVSDGDVPLRTVELFDPKTDAFVTGGAIGAPRFNHVAVALPDGRVLIAGGESVRRGNDAFASAELYDPETMRAVSTGSMRMARTRAGGVLLDDGRTLIAGGKDARGRYLSSAEVYDPRAGTFAPTGSMATPRVGHCLTRLADGRVLVTGGQTGWDDPALASAEVYNPETGRFEPTGSMNDARQEHAATLLADGRVLITGGQTKFKGQTLASAEAYDPRAGAFEPVGSMRYPRRVHNVIRLTDGRVLIVGGAGTRDHPAAEVFDPATARFAVSADPLIRRHNAVAVRLAGGRVLVVGGYHLQSRRRMTQAEVFCP